VFCPEPKVTGAVAPLKLKPVPLTAIFEIVTLVPPVLVTVSRRDELLPTVTLPKLRLVGLEVSKPGEAPVPVNPIVNEGFEALEVTVTLPLALPVDVGVKTTWKLVLCPAPSVTGLVTPLRLNPVPLTATCEIVTLVPPVFVTVSRSDELLPTVTVPKLRLVGFDVSRPGETPVAVRGISSAGFDALDMTVTLPVAAPAEVGVNRTLKLVLCPAPTVIGVVTPLKLNPVPLMATPEIVTLVPPVFVRVSESDESLPTVIFPNPRLVGLEVRPPGAAPLPDTAIASGEFEALDVIVTLPLALVADAGVNVT